MNANTTRRTAQFFALPIVAAAILAGALAFAGAANAETNSPAPRPPSIVATPTVTAHPAPGAPHTHGIPHLQQVQPGYQR
ncbi:hypothetical protein [Mycobacterium sp. 852014-52144_SCH5372336]|uniref:hypothetical protein n=1 Tax=Mycobacterium sp. 852014-52144_SCH5372336 TaxID=1834115 RepID=UPI0007FF5262|nr:hypothetical protein [Mycobacterium sp. 852014-52144_SCH5372336]OBB71279.1 hypothetical protein A5759_22855 [Mycobacterium sp. 852014-52144_SCH5372336]